MPYFQEGYVHYVVDAVFTLVIAVQNLIDETCPGTSGTGSLCEQFYPFNGTRLLVLLRNVTFRNGNAEREREAASRIDGMTLFAC